MHIILPTIDGCREDKNEKIPNSLPNFHLKLDFEKKDEKFSEVEENLKKRTVLVLRLITISFFYIHKLFFLQNIPGWWIWFYYICPVAWTLRGIISSQLGDVETQVVGPGFRGSVKEYIEVSLGYGSGMVGVSAAVLVGFVFLFFSIYAASIKILNFQKR